MVWKLILVSWLLKIVNKIKNMQIQNFISKNREKYKIRFWKPEQTRDISFSLSFSFFFSPFSLFSLSSICLLPHEFWRRSSPHQSITDATNPSWPSPTIGGPGSGQNSVERLCPTALPFPSQDTWIVHMDAISGHDDCSLE